MATGITPDPGQPAIRNVVLVGHAGSGKSTLLHALRGRAAAGGPPGSPGPPGPPFPSPACWPVVHDGVTINLFDTPGHPDFVGALHAGLRAADAALFVVSGIDGVDARTGQLWEQCAAAALPRAVVVTQLDRPGADFDEAVAVCQRVFGEGVHPLYLPLHADDESVAGVLSLLVQRVFDWSSGDRVERRPEPEHLPLIASLRAELIEAVLAESEDEQLLDAYLQDAAMDPSVLVAELESAVTRGHLHPVLAAAPLTGLGTEEVLQLLARAFPAPLERRCPAVTRPDGSPAPPLTGDPDGPLAAEVVWTTTDPDAGRICLVRVFSGTLRRDSAVHVSGHGPTPAADRAAQVGPLFAAGSPARPVPLCRAGDVCTVLGLTTARTADTLSDPDEPLLLEGWQLPDPQLPVALEPRDPREQEVLASALERVAAEDPTARVERAVETGQLLLWAVGAQHADALIGRLGVEVARPAVRVALRADPDDPATTLEPVSAVEVRVAPAAVGAVLRDLRRRRAELTTTDEDDDDQVLVRAVVPDLELLDYAAALRSVSHGTATARRRYLRHQPAPLP